MIDGAKAILAEILGVPAEGLPDNALGSDLSEWDSLAHLRIVMRLEEEIGRRLSAEEILGLRGLADIEALLRY